MTEFLFYQTEESGMGSLNDIKQSESSPNYAIRKIPSKRAPRILNFMNALNISIEYPLSPFNEG